MLEMIKKLLKKSVKKTAGVSSKRPVGIAILSVLGYMGAVVALLFGIFYIFYTGVVALYSVQDYFGKMTVGLFILLAILSLGLAVLYYFMARGLWNGKNWARITQIVLSVLGLILALSSFGIGGIFSLIINGLIILYLGFYKPALAYFK